MKAGVVERKATQTQVFHLFVFITELELIFCFFNLKGLIFVIKTKLKD